MREQYENVIRTERNLVGGYPARLTISEARDWCEFCHTNTIYLELQDANTYLNFYRGLAAHGAVARMDYEAAVTKARVAEQEMYYEAKRWDEARRAAIQGKPEEAE